MTAQVVDAVIIVDTAVGLHRVVGTQTVFHQEQRFLVAVIQLVHGDAQAQRVDGPAPLAGLQIGVLHRAHHVAVVHGLALQAGRHAAAGVVAEGDEVHGVLPQQGVIAGLGVQLHLLFRKQLAGVAGVAAPHLHVDEEQVFLLLLHRLPDVLRVAGVGVEAAAGQHAAHLIGGVVLVGQAGGRGAGQQHMVGRLIDHLTAVLALLEGDACPGEGTVQQDVDLVEGKPVVHKAGVFFEAGLGVAGKAFQRFAAAPGAVLLHQTHGDVKVAQGDQRLNAVLPALLEHIAVKGHALRVGGPFIAVGVQAGP